MVYYINPRPPQTTIYHIYGDENRSEYREQKLGFHNNRRQSQ